MPNLVPTGSDWFPEYPEPVGHRSGSHPLRGGTGTSTTGTADLGETDTLPIGTGIGNAKPVRAKGGRRRTFKRTVFTGTAVVATGATWTLRLDRVAWRRTVDRDGGDLGVVRIPNAVLWADVGDALVVAAADLASDSIAWVVVVAVSPAGRPTVRCATGTMPVGYVDVLPARKART